ncbi:MAG: Ni/Fe hydrogenase subunit alpha [Candidatus Thorarchaeota archaeon]|nr:MAG: Ni/Fe hydrogenase subunit alpha [Candidatus Thorarchaeota archaeon]RLI55181.1 MAG: Ni/Fe hydrogenase subunit alpha [Candidatus Thorarchaeota archaeon]
MSEDKIIRIDPVTRLEGHGSLTLKLGKDGKVKDVQFNVSSTRFFEKFLEGRPMEEAPRIASRICGICPIPHHLASVKTVEAAWGITPPPAAVKIRRLMIEAKQLSSHAIHFYALAAPDFVFGPFADPSVRNVAAVLKHLPDVAVQAIKLMEFGQELIKTVGAKAIHPTTAIPGGQLTPLKEEDRDLWLGRVPEMLENIHKTVDLAKKVVNDYIDVVTKVAVAPTYYIGLTNKGVLDIYEGTVRVMDPEGNIVADFEPKDYTQYYGEHIPDHSYATHIYYKPVGYPEGIWRTNTLARCNVADKMATPLADAALKEMRELVGRPSHHTFAYHYARVVEMVQAAEWIKTLLEDPEIVSTDIKLSDVEPRAGEGVGLVEAPRGTLLHNYESDDKGMLVKANLIVATNNNIAGIEKSLMVAAKQIFEDKAHESLKLPEPMVKT